MAGLSGSPSNSFSGCATSKIHRYSIQMYTVRPQIIADHFSANCYTNEGFNYSWSIAPRFLKHEDALVDGSGTKLTEDCNTMHFLWEMKFNFHREDAQTQCELYSLWSCFHWDRLLSLLGLARKRSIPYSRMSSALTVGSVRRCRV